MTSQEKIIYGLVDPNLNKIRYVGRSSSGLWRPNAHRYPSRLSRGQTHCDRWIRKLLAGGQDYSVMVLETSVVDLNAREKYWIAYGKAQGWPLTNITEGGGGTVGYRHSTGTRKKIAKALSGKRFTAEHRRKISETLLSKEIKPTPEHMRKMHRARVGSHHTRASKELISNRRGSAVIDMTTGVVYPSHQAASDALGIHRQNIDEVCRGLRRTAGGRFFRQHS